MQIRQSEIDIHYDVAETAPIEADTVMNVNHFERTAKTLALTK